MENKEDLTSMLEVLSNLRKEGYTTDFKVTGDEQLSTMDDKETFRPEQVRIVNFYRFEGESNPDDMSILYVLETKTGLKGTISNSYGTYADGGTDIFLKKVQDLGKDIDKEEQ
jgi:hypothetical protein